MKRCLCFDCEQPTGRDDSRIVWLKDLRIERRLCRHCLKRRGLSFVSRCYDGPGGTIKYADQAAGRRS